jgi:hypothetical protein
MADNTLILLENLSFNDSHTFLTWASKLGLIPILARCNQQSHLVPQALIVLTNLIVFTKEQAED